MECCRGGGEGKDFNHGKSFCELSKHNSTMNLEVFSFF